MRLIRYFKPGGPPDEPVCLAIGNFDGLHRGHQALIARTLASELASGLMCFEPLPASYFRPDCPVQRITGVRDKVGMCRDLGLERMYLLRFDARLAGMSPERFAADIVARAAGARQVVVGEDFRFGARAAGDVDSLRAFGARFGFDVQVVAAVGDNGEPDSTDRISSSFVRQALAEGRLDRAERALGRAYRISGRVLRGQALGRKLGYPTVNLRPPVPPALTGICAVRVHGAGLEGWPGVASLGRRPTVAGSSWLLEVHLFDFDGDLYGRHLAVEFVAWIRHERKFDDLAAMTVQMNADADLARRLLQPRKTGLETA